MARETDARDGAAPITESKIAELRERVARTNRCSCGLPHEVYDVPMSAGELRALLDALDAATARATALHDALADLLGAECLCPVRVDGTCNTVRHNTARAALAASSGAVVGET